jgi:hypothetical protein
MTDNLSVADFGTTVVHYTHREDKTQNDQTRCSQGLRFETQDNINSGDQA